MLISLFPGDGGNLWQEARVSLLDIGSYPVEFEGIMGGGYFSDLAVDDVTVTQGGCA